MNLVTKLATLRRLYVEMRRDSKPIELGTTKDGDRERLVYFDSKSPSSGETAGAPILLLHGFTAKKETCYRQMDVSSC